MANLAEHLKGLTPLQRAVFTLKETSARLENLERSLSEPIAIVGMACRFPGGATSPAEFWRLLSGSVDAIGEVPADRWDVDAYYDPDPATPGKMNSRYGGFLERVDLFDNEFFGITEREARGIDPQQRLLLELAWEAFDDAGIPPASLRGSDTGVFVGISGSDYGLLLSSDLRMTDAFVGTGSSLSISANRVSFAFDLHGPSLAIDTACSSSLVAAHLACNSLRMRESGVALVGGVNIILSPAYAVSLTKVGLLSPTGKVRAFDADANGYVRGEGGGMLVLKLLSKALEDGDPIHALIKGSALNEDGFSNGLTAPNRQSQEAVMRSAYRQARITPETVDYVECHGTGTLLGDTIEASALGNVVGVGRSVQRPCLIGAVKSHLGHMEAAAGMASLIKTVLALKYQQIPATLHYTKANPNVPFQSLGLRVVHTPMPWPVKEQPAVAGVSAFGFGGSNAHMVLEQAPVVRATRADPEARATESILPISARNPVALHSLAHEFLGLLRNPDVNFCDLCHSAAARRDHHDQRLALTAVTREQAIAQLESYLAVHSAPALHTAVKPYGRRPRTVLVFAERLASWKEFVNPLIECSATFRQSMQEWDQRFSTLADFSLLADLEKSIACMPNSFLFSLQTSLASLWRQLGVTADAVVGLGGGELAAAYYARALDAEQAARIAMSRDLAGNDARAQALLAELRPATAGIPFISASHGEVRNGRKLDLAHWRQNPGALPPVEKVVDALQDSLPDCFLEMGPAVVMPDLAKRFRVLNPQGRSLASLTSGVAPLADAIAQMYVTGHMLNWKKFYGQGHRYIPLPAYPWQRQRLWMGGLQPSRPVVSISALTAPATSLEVPTAAHAANEAKDPSAARIRPKLTTPYEDAHTELEIFITAAWQRVLKLDQIGLYDNFFELGGESLQAAALVNQLQKDLGETVHMLALFEAQTVSALADFLRKHYPVAVKRMCPSEVVGDTEYIDPDWPNIITDAEVEKARALVESYVPRPEAKRLRRTRNPRAIFILSPPRSGSTLFRVMLAGHPQLFVPPELELLPFDDLGERREAYGNLAGMWLEGPTRALLELFAGDSVQAETAMRRYETERMPTADFYRLLQDKAGGKTLVDKTPGYSSQLQVMQRAEKLFEDPLYIHLMRHPCGMIRSFLDYKMDQTYRIRYSVKQKFPYSPRQLGELVWTLSHQNILHLLSGVPASRQFGVRFEDLVRQPEQTMRSLSEFLGLDYAEAMADPYRDKHLRMTDALTQEGRMQGDQNFLVKHQKIDPSVADRWSQVMTSDFLGAPTRRVAVQLGYTDLSAPVVEHGTTLVSKSGSALVSDQAQDLLARLSDMSESEVDTLLDQMQAEAEHER